MGMNFSRPFGTWSIRTLFPRLKRWAIVARSLRDSKRVSRGPEMAKPRKSRYNVVTLLSRTLAFAVHL